MEKPKSAEEAKAMLRLHSGSTHTVITGVAVLRRNGNMQPAPRHSSSRSTPELSRFPGTAGEPQAIWRETHFSESARVTFATLTDAEIDAYVATGVPPARLFSS
jgi:predicted house-cleaning NTP pyrophosphatase (Maf/HAM1 superfamily)